MITRGCVRSEILDTVQALHQSQLRNFGRVGNAYGPLDRDAEEAVVSFQAIDVLDLVEGHPSVGQAAMAYHSEGVLALIGEPSAIFL